MPAPRKSRPTDGIFEINMTPLIDVSLVLVVILMVATPLAFQSGITVGRAARSAQAARPVRTERLEVEVVSVDEVWVNRTPVPRSELAAHLEEWIAESATRRVVVRCADQVSHGTFVAVLDDVRQSGAADIAVVGGPHAP